MDEGGIKNGQRNSDVFYGRPTVGQDGEKCKETSSPLVNKQQKVCGHVENF